MGNIEKYFENTQNALPNENIEQFIKMKVEPGRAIDLGCGAGRDTIYLIKNNWNVLSIDREDTRDFIEKRLDVTELERFKFLCQNFENIKLEENNLIVSNYSIPFCSKDYFQEFWHKIVESILPGRIFCRKFFWIK